MSEKIDLKKKRVLVTGAGGFIGSHLTERLASTAKSVRAFVRYNSRNDRGLLEILPSEIRDEIDIVMSDLRDYDAVRQAMQDVDVVFHLGALIAIPYSYLYPHDVATTNVTSTLNILNAARHLGTEKVVHTSTSEVYGTAVYTPINEEHPLQAQSPYSATKIAADKLAESFYCTYELPVATIRPFNSFGPRQSARAVIPTIVSQALSQDKIVLGSLHPLRDLTYVADTADGFIKIAESPASIGQVINIGSGAEITIGDLTKKILDIMGKELEIEADPQRVRPQDSEVERLLADITKAKELVGWEPKTSLDEGLKHTIEWIRQNLDRYKPRIYNV